MFTDLLIAVAPPLESKSQQLAKLLPEIKAALKAGYRHEVIHEHIKNTVGLDLTFRYYKTILHRIRKRRDELGARTSPRSPFAAPAKAGPVAALEPTDNPQRVFEYDVTASIADFFS
jgi:hypothetical protein